MALTDTERNTLRDAVRDAVTDALPDADRDTVRVHVDTLDSDPVYHPDAHVVLVRASIKLPIPRDPAAHGADVAPGLRGLVPPDPRPGS